MEKEIENIDKKIAHNFKYFYDNKLYLIMYLYYDDITQNKELYKKYIWYTKKYDSFILKKKNIIEKAYSNKHINKELKNVVKRLYYKICAFQYPSYNDFINNINQNNTLFDNKNLKKIQIISYVNSYVDADVRKVIWSYYMQPINENKEEVLKLLKARKEFAKERGFAHWMEYTLSFTDEIKNYNELMRKLIDLRANLNLSQRLREFAETYYPDDKDDIFAPWNAMHKMRLILNESYNANRPAKKNDAPITTIETVTNDLYNILDYVLKKNKFSYKKDTSIQYHFSVFTCDIYNNENKCIGKILFDCFYRANKKPDSTSHIINVESMHNKHAITTCIVNMNIEINNLNPSIYYTYIHEIGHCLDWMINANPSGYFINNLFVRYKHDVEIPSMCFENYFEKDPEFKKKFITAIEIPEKIRLIEDLIDDYSEYLSISNAIWDALLHGPYDYNCYEEIVNTITETTTIPGTRERIDNNMVTFFRHFSTYGGEYFSYFMYKMK